MKICHSCSRLHSCLFKIAQKVNQHLSERHSSPSWAIGSLACWHARGSDRSRPGVLLSHSRAEDRCRTAFEVPGNVEVHGNPGSTAKKQVANPVNQLGWTSSTSSEGFSRTPA